MSFSTRPNLVYILADDMGFGDLSCLNADSKIRTTHLDRLAREGMIFRDAHASSAVCTPSRYSILTGRYNWRSILKAGVTLGYSEAIIEKDRTTVAGFLRDHGYTTGCIGKWHLGWSWANSGDSDATVDFTQPIQEGPTTRGFDYFFGISASLDMAPYVYVENDRVTAVPIDETPGSSGKRFWRPGPIAPDFDFEQVLPTLTRKAIGFIEEQAADEKPFFLYYPLPAPHTPILPLPQFQGESGTNDYGDFCLQVDDTVGQLMATVDSLGIGDNTIFIFASDNGCSPMADFPELAQAGHHPSYIFRGHKADIYEGGHRIPLLVRWPDAIGGHGVCDQTVCLADLFATMAEVVGGILPDTAGEDSVSNLPLWRGEADHRSLREATVHHSVNGSFSIRKGQWKLELCPDSGGWSFPVPGRDEVSGLPPMQLYDLAADISERRNVFDEHPQVVAELQALLTRYIREGRSTPGKPQPNTGPPWWPQLRWLGEEELQP